MDLSTWFRKAVEKRSAKKWVLPANVMGRRIFARTHTADIGVARTCFSGEFNAAILAAKPLTHNFIIDAGGYIGTAAMVFAEAFPHARIVTLEPAHENFAILQRNVRPYPNIIAMNKALASQRGTTSLVDRGTGECGFSIVQKPRDKRRPARLQRTKTITIPDLMTKFGSSGIDILKLDIEGAERDLLSDRPAWMPSVRVLFVELHDRIVADCSTTFADATAGRKNLRTKGEKRLSVL